jgi:LmbE family N-acetylglucosaminyl deacetylase
MRAIAEVNFPTHVQVNIRDVVHVKEAASACHASQGGIEMRRGFIGWFVRIFGEKEDYMQAFPPVDGKFKTRFDLFYDWRNISD